jgi:hypothetical protein
VKEQIVEIGLSASGVRDTARVLQVNKNTVCATFKKTSAVSQRNDAFTAALPDEEEKRQLNDLLLQVRDYPRHDHWPFHQRIFLLRKQELD